VRGYNPIVLRRPGLFLPAFAVIILALGLIELRGIGAPPTPLHGAFGHGPTVVLVHGLGSRAEHWLPVARRLARQYRVVLVELPGHGSSGMPEPFSLERATQALGQALDAESREPVILVGHSVGGLVAVSAALAQPQRVRGLVLVETLLEPQLAGAELDAMLHELDDNYQGLLRSAFMGFGRDSAQGLGLYLEAASVDSTNLKRWIRLALTVNLAEPASKLAMPVLAVLAPHSWPLSEPWRETAAAMGYARIPDVRPVRIADCGHFIMLDRPDELARVIARFASHPNGEPLARN
jgi:pimeloyl-ACP methyl ester carboxylesterase